MAETNAQILEAMKIIAENTIKTLQYNKTIIGTIVSKEKNNYGTNEDVYKVSYQGNIFTAYANLNSDYAKGDSVYINIPNNDFTQKKKIQGSATVALDTDAEERLRNYYIDIKPVIDISTDYWTYDPTKGKTAYVFETNKDLENLTGNDKYDIIKLQIGINTELTEANKNFKFYVKYFDEDDKEVDSIPINNFTGNLNSLKTDTGSQDIYIGYNHLKHKKINLFFDTTNSKEAFTNKDKVSIEYVKMNYSDIIDFTDEKHKQYSYIEAPAGNMFDIDSTNQFIIRSNLIDSGNDVSKSSDYECYWYINIYSGNQEKDGDFDPETYAGPMWLYLAGNNTNEINLSDIVLQVSIEKGKEEASLFEILAAFKNTYKYLPNITIKLITNYKNVYTENKIDLIPFSSTDPVEKKIYTIDSLVKSGSIEFTAKLGGEEKVVDWYTANGTKIQENSSHFTLSISDVTDNFYFYLQTLDKIGVYKEVLIGFVYNIYQEVLQQLYSSEELNYYINGITSYQYDNNGNILLEDASITKTLTPMFLSSGITDIQWRYIDDQGKENIIPNNSSEAVDLPDSLITKCYTSSTTDSNYGLYYNVAATYDINKSQNNSFILKFNHKGVEKKIKVEVFFSKVGEPGTNGTNYSCELYYNPEDILIINSKTDTETQEVPEPKLKIYKNGIDITDKVETQTAVVTHFYWYTEGEYKDENEGKKYIELVYRNFYENNEKDFITKLKNDYETFSKKNKEGLDFSDYIPYIQAIYVYDVTVDDHLIHSYCGVPYVFASKVFFNNFTLPSYITYESNGNNPRYYQNNFKINNNNIDLEVRSPYTKDGSNFTYAFRGKLSKLQSEIEGEEPGGGTKTIKIIDLPFNFDRTSSKINNDTNIEDKFHIDTGFYLNKIPLIYYFEEINNLTGCLIYPLVCNLNSYGNDTINNWDGLEVKINDGSVLANQIIAGHKNNDNTFSGVVLGDEKITNENRISKNGILGYFHGEQSFYISSEGDCMLKGEIEASSGKIGGWNINEDGISTSWEPKAEDENIKIFVNLNHDKGLEYSFEDNTESAPIKKGSLKYTYTRDAGVVVNFGLFGDPALILTANTNPQTAENGHCIQITGEDIYFWFDTKNVYFNKKTLQSLILNNANPQLSYEEADDLAALWIECCDDDGFLQKDLWNKDFPIWNQDHYNYIIEPQTIVDMVLDFYNLKETIFIDKQMARKAFMFLNWR